MKDIVCVACPIGCEISILDENNINISGNKCDKGYTYAKEEIQNPSRILTTTVHIIGALHNRLPVRTSKPIPKAEIMSVMKKVYSITVDAPISNGQMLCQNVFENVSLIATRSMQKK